MMSPDIRLMWEPPHFTVNDFGTLVAMIHYIIDRVLHTWTKQKIIKKGYFVRIN